jgi:hypothetical protein
VWKGEGITRRMTLWIKDNRVDRSRWHIIENAPIVAVDTYEVYSLCGYSQKEVRLPNPCVLADIPDFSSQCKSCLLLYGVK